MKRFWLIRSNLTNFEYYHQYENLTEFENNCHDYYLLFPLWLLKNNYFDEVIIWRLGNHKDIIFDVNGKKFIQKWVNNFKEMLLYSSPDISFWRGGFKEYCNVIKINKKHFGKSLYLAAGIRQYPQYGGKYDVILIEDERDINSIYNCKPFYKTASPYVFKPLNYEKNWDVCWPCNFTQIKYKGQEEFISLIAKDDFLKSIKIVHCGNNVNDGINLCKKYNIKNIQFLGSKNRTELNIILNMSKLGLNLSNRTDGCPRISTEILMSGTPLILNEETRILKYFRQHCINANFKNLSKKIKWGLENYNQEKEKVINIINNEISFDTINKLNLNFL